MSTSKLAPGISEGWSSAIDLNAANSADGVVVPPFRMGVTTWRGAGDDDDLGTPNTEINSHYNNIYGISKKRWINNGENRLNSVNGKKRMEWNVEMLELSLSFITFQSSSLHEYSPIGPQPTWAGSSIASFSTIFVISAARLRMPGFVFLFLPGVWNRWGMIAVFHTLMSIILGQKTENYVEYRVFWF